MNSPGRRRPECQVSTRNCGGLDAEEAFVEKLSTRGGALARLARTCYLHRRRVLATWIALLLLVGFLSKAAGGKDTTKFSLPGTESQQAVDLLKARFPARSGDTADIVFAAPGTGGVDNPGIEARINAAVLAAGHSNPHVSGVVSPFSPQGAHQISADRHVA